MDKKAASKFLFEITLKKVIRRISLGIAGELGLELTSFTSVLDDFLKDYGKLPGETEIFKYNIPRSELETMNILLTSLKNVCYETERFYNGASASNRKSLIKEMPRAKDLEIRIVNKILCQYILHNKQGIKIAEEQKEKIIGEIEKILRENPPDDPWLKEDFVELLEKYESETAMSFQSVYEQDHKRIIKTLESYEKSNEETRTRIENLRDNVEKWKSELKDRGDDENQKEKIKNININIEELIKKIEHINAAIEIVKKTDIRKVKDHNELMEKKINEERKTLIELAEKIKSMENSVDSNKNELESALKKKVSHSKLKSQSEELWDKMKQYVAKNRGDLNQEMLKIEEELKQISDNKNESSISNTLADLEHKFNEIENSIIDEENVLKLIRNYIEERSRSHMKNSENPSSMREEKETIKVKTSKESDKSKKRIDFTDRPNVEISNWQGNDTFEVENDNLENLALENESVITDEELINLGKETFILHGEFDKKGFLNYVKDKYSLDKFKRIQRLLS